MEIIYNLTLLNVLFNLHIMIIFLLNLFFDNCLLQETGAKMLKKSVILINFNEKERI